MRRMQWESVVTPSRLRTWILLLAGGLVAAIAIFLSAVYRICLGNVFRPERRLALVLDTQFISAFNRPRS
jgi:hypothetical protein